MNSCTNYSGHRQANRGGNNNGAAELKAFDQLLILQSSFLPKNYLQHFTFLPILMRIKNIYSDTANKLKLKAYSFIYLPIYLFVIQFRNKGLFLSELHSIID